MHIRIKPTHVAAALLAALFTSATMAQTSASAGANTSSRSSWLPYTHDGYIGIDVGRSSFQNNCGGGGFGCDRSDRSARVVLGGYFNPNFGAEIGYADFGDIQRAGGSTRAHGLNLSLVARAPLTQNLGLYGKIGTTYGRTRVSAALGSGIASGSENGWGPAYGLGVSWNFTPEWSATLEWNRQRFDYAGNTDSWIRSTSIGIRYHF